MDVCFVCVLILLSMNNETNNEIYQIIPIYQSNIHIMKYVGFFVMVVGRTN